MRGIHRYPPVDGVVYGIPLAEALANEVKRLDAGAVYVMASGTLARETGVIDEVRSVLGNRLAGVCTKIGAHTPRIDVVAAANEARAAGADAIVTPTDSTPSRQLSRRMAKRCVPRSNRPACARSPCRPRCRRGNSHRSPVAPTRYAIANKATVMR